jgi:DNA-directed RNA polymerase sigma subunit (sigma70/sigma32)
MSEIVVAKINSFAPLAAQTDFPVSPSEEAVFILNSGQLQEIISQAVQKAIEPLQDRIGDLEKIVAAQGEQIATLTSTQEQDVTRICLDIAYDRQRLARLEKVSKEKPAPSPTRETTQKTEAHITEIAHILGAKETRLIEGGAARPYVDKLRKEGMTFSQLANVLGLTVDRVRQLSRIAATDQRFNITWHPRKKNTKIIKLRRWDALVL